MRAFWALAAAIAAAMTVRAAQPPPAEAAVAAPAPAPQKVSLRGSSIYIYTFLDVRENEFGLEVLDQVDEQLLARFAGETVRAKVLRFRNSPIGQNFSAGGSTYYGSSTAFVPVERVIAANRVDEEAVGARYRLVVFPANYEITGAWQYYEIRWDLYDTQSGRLIWSFVYNAQHMKRRSTSQNSAKRAKKFIDQPIETMRRKGYI